jgi:hypothetical protein
MKPAEAMGTFLRTWRSEWAGLSREQLAIAVSAQCGTRRRVTAPVVRHWEQGQPPASTAEFEALLTVMGRKSLSRPEVDDFRKSVLAALCDRQYTGLFEDDGFAYREDVDIAAWHMSQGPNHPRDLDVVTLVARIKDVEAALRGNTGCRASGSDLTRQQMALVYLRQGLAERVGAAGRPAQAAQEHTAAARLIQEFFGQRPPFPLSLFTELMQAVGNRGLASRSAAEVGRLLDLSEQAQAAGDSGACSLAFMAAVSLSAWFGTPQMRDALRRQAEPHLEAHRSWTWWPKAAEMACAPLFEGAVKDGLWDEAERVAPALESWQHETGTMFQSMWHACMGDFAAARGDYDEALHHYEHVIAHATLWDSRYREEDFVQRAERCEQALRSRRLRKAGSGKPSAQSRPKRSKRSPKGEQ